MPKTKKPARKRATIQDQRRLLREQWAEDFGADPLPFKIVEHGYIPDPDINSHPLEPYHWTVGQCRLAEGAMRAGFKLAVFVPVAVVGQAASAIARSLRGDVFMGYDSRRELLILWGDREDEDDEAD